MTRSRQRRQHADSGASLILAIGFVLMIGLIGGGLAALATSGVGNRTTLQRLRDRQYAADGAIAQAITQVRIDMTAATASGTSIQSICSSASGPTVSTMNGVEIRVDWVNSCLLNDAGVTGSDGSRFNQRNVIFSACVNAGAACDPAKVIIRAEVSFQQPSPTDVIRTYVLSWSVIQ